MLCVVCWFLTFLRQTAFLTGPTLFVCMSKSVLDVCIYKQQTTLNNRRFFSDAQYSTMKRFPSVLPAKSDSDVIFVYKVIRVLESIYHLSIYPIPG